MVCCADVAIQSAGGDHLTAEAAGDPVPACACSPVALAAPSLVVGLGPRCRQLLPCHLEAGARPVECLGNPAAVIARFAAGIEAARPAPLRRGVRDACAAAD